MDGTVSDGLARTEALMLSLVGTFSGAAQEASAFHFSSGGKRIRAQLALSASSALDLPSQTGEALAAACELTHNASLVHDDIQDRSTKRRQAASVWARFGAETAICTGDLMISAAYAALAQSGSSRLAALLNRTHVRIAEVIAGQCADLDTRMAPVSSVDAYKLIAAGKSAPLLALPLELPLIAADREDLIADVEAASREFSIAYQMADDIDDVETDLTTGDLNLVTLLGGETSDSPEAHRVRQMAADGYREAARLAAGLPNGGGALMVAYALKGAARLNALEVA